MTKQQLVEHAIETYQEKTRVAFREMMKEIKEIEKNFTNDGD